MGATSSQLEPCTETGSQNPTEDVISEVVDSNALPVVVNIGAENQTPSLQSPLTWHSAEDSTTKEVGPEKLQAAEPAGGPMTLASAPELAPEFVQTTEAPEPDQLPEPPRLDAFANDSCARRPNRRKDKSLISQAQRAQARTTRTAHGSSSPAACSQPLAPPGSELQQSQPERLSEIDLPQPPAGLASLEHDEVGNRILERHRSEPLLLPSWPATPHSTSHCDDSCCKLHEYLGQPKHVCSSVHFCIDATPIQCAQTTREETSSIGQTVIYRSPKCAPDGVADLAGSAPPELDGLKDTPSPGIAPGAATGGWEMRVDSATAMSSTDVWSWTSTNDEVQTSQQSSEVWTNIVTVLLRNVPNVIKQSTLLSKLDAEGFVNTYDFLYLPMDMHTKMNRGYAFINFTKPLFARKFKMQLEGRKFGHGGASEKRMQMEPAALQGFEENYHRYVRVPRRARRCNRFALPFFLHEPNF